MINIIHGFKNLIHRYVVRKHTRYLLKLSFFLILIIASWILFEIIVRGGGIVNEKYGIKPTTFFILLIISEIVFDLGILMILIAQKIEGIGFRKIFQYDISEILSRNYIAYTGFTLNRVAALAPVIYLLFYGWGKLPFFIVLLLIIELLIVFAISLLPFNYGNKFNAKNPT